MTSDYPTAYHLHLKASLHPGDMIILDLAKGELIVTRRSWWKRLLRRPA